VTSQQAATVLIDVEVYNSNGTRATQVAFDAQSFTPGQRRTFPMTWTVAGGTTGTQVIKSASSAKAGGL
jgi:hypothetical protein